MIDQRTNNLLRVKSEIKPPVVVINFGRRENAAQVQAALDEIL
jgi:hypothetical protein